MELRSKKTCVMSDEQIVELYWQRNEQAIRETDIKYKKFLMSVAYNIVHDERDCEECLSDTYIGAWNAIPPARPVLLQAFLSTIMRRIAINRYNSGKRQRRITSEFTISLSELEDLMADDCDVVTEIQAKELANIISDYVRSLPKRQMYVFISRYYLTESVSKISKELGCSISTVKREITSVKKGLKNKLESEGYVL